MRYPTISIIVPVYNVDKYIANCIESIINQTYKEFELLLIDDGSTDESGKICDSYAAKDSRIKVIHKKNGGVSEARNFGLRLISGTWVTFVDADDALNKDTFTECAQFLSEYDVIRFSMEYIMNEDKSHIIHRQIDDTDNKEKYIKKVISRDAILGVCGGLYRSVLFHDNHIFFDKDLIAGEDWVVQFKLLMRSNKIKILNRPYYQYNRYNQDSCTNNKFSFQLFYSAIKSLNIIQTLSNIEVNGILSNIDVNRSVARAKCDLVYDFLASKLKRGYKISKEDVSKYNNTADLKFKEVLWGSTNIKQKFLLLLYISPLGKYFLTL